MHRGAWQATVHGVAESDMTEQLTVTLSLLSQVLVQAHHFLTDFSFTCLYVIDPSPPSFLPWLVETNMFSLSIMQNKDRLSLFHSCLSDKPFLSFIQKIGPSTHKWNCITLQKASSAMLGLLLFCSVFCSSYSKRIFSNLVLSDGQDTLKGWWFYIQDEQYRFMVGPFDLNHASFIL